MNLNQHLAAQHADYEADLETPFYGLDECPLDDTLPYELDTDTTDTRPCNTCGHTDNCLCLDNDSPFGHHATRWGW